MSLPDLNKDVFMPAFLDKALRQLGRRFGRQPASAATLIERYQTKNQQLAARIALLPDRERLASIREQAPVVSRLLRDLAPLIGPQSNGLALQDQIVQEFERLGWQPMLVGYKGYPAAVPISIGKAVLSGFPTANPLPDNALVTIELIAASSTAYLAQSWTFAGAKADAKQLALLEAGRQALKAGVACIRPGERVDAIGEAIAEVLDAHDLQPVIEYSGHGMGKDRMQSPLIFCYRNNYSKNERLQVGQILNVLVPAKPGARGIRFDTRNLQEVSTQDGKEAVVFSAMVEVTQEGHRLLSEWVD